MADKSDESTKKSNDDPLPPCPAIFDNRMEK